ncbi:hypothetical protein [Nocardia abscessus]|uniref:hypothetical protein n=1 Tax=Nocardia abscessus TaxID=120957 RepID=UPI002455EDDC|nr:hypothetical protein [Nocardia abscessus]
MNPEQADPIGWGVAANITESNRYFVAGAKVWVSLPTGGEGTERLVVVGHHRGTGHRLVKVITASKRLTNFRVRGIYSPTVYAMFAEWPGQHWASKDAAEEFVASLAGSSSSV